MMENTKVVTTYYRMNKVLNKFATYNTDEIVNYMHKEKAYEDTKQNDIIKYDLAEYISL